MEMENDEEFKRYLVQQEELMKKMKELYEKKKQENHVLSESRYTTTPLDKYQSRAAKAFAKKHEMATEEKSPSIRDRIKAILRTKAFRITVFVAVVVLVGITGYYIVSKDETD